MISKNQVKLITSLNKKKYREKHQLFVVEGMKSIKEFISSGFEVHSIFSIRGELKSKFPNLIEVTESELKKISYLTTPNIALALFKLPKTKPIDFDALIIGLDNVQDPGNLGTIIRLCDWFGIKNLVCNLKTVDCYNPKVIQASMGSLARVNITYMDLEKFLIKSKIRPVYGTFMTGESIYESSLNNSGILIMGNEANGISNQIKEKVTNRISIPKFNKSRKTESLNVATATAIVLSEFMRQTTEK